jgi:hypothetical protein
LNLGIALGLFRHLVLRQKIIERLSPKDSPGNTGRPRELLEPLELLVIDVDHFGFAFGPSHTSYNALQCPPEAISIASVFV